jgi:hypothetical protein
MARSFIVVTWHDHVKPDIRHKLIEQQPRLKRSQFGALLLHTGTRQITGRQIADARSDSRILYSLPGPLAGVVVGTFEEKPWGGTDRINQL